MRGLKLFNRNVTDPLMDNSYSNKITPAFDDSGARNEELEDLYFQAINKSNPFVGNKQDFADYLKNKGDDVSVIDANDNVYNSYELKNLYGTSNNVYGIPQIDYSNLELKNNNYYTTTSPETITDDNIQQPSNNIVKNTNTGGAGISNVISSFTSNNGANIQQQTPKLSFGQKWDALNASKGVQKAAKGVGAGAAIAGIAADIGDARMNANYKNNQGAYVSGAFGKNQMLSDAYNTNTAIASTNYNDAMSQYKNINKNIDSQMTTKLSNKQRWGLVGVGAGKGAATGAAIGSLAGPIGTVVGTAAGTVIGAAAGAFKGHNANKQIAETNEALRDKKTTANNYLNYSFGDIKNRNANLRRRSMFGNVEAYGGNLYANGGALQDPYGINYFGEGHSHENNRFGGVPVSIAEDGKPNLVEEGEVLYDDYVYSKRIKLPDSMRRQLNLKDDVKTFADAAKAIQERGKERPNDPVMEHTIKAQMQKLKSKQEEVKEKKEQREQEKMLAQMSEQERQILEQQQMNQQADAYEQQMAAEQQAQMAQQQMPQEGMPQEQMAMQEQRPAMPYAEGGKLKGGTNDIDSHKFAKEDEEPQGYDWDSFEINGNRYNFANKGDRSKGMWDYGYNDDGSDDEFYNYYSKIFKEGNDGYFTDNYTDYYKNAVEWARNLPTEDKEKFLEKYEPYYEQEFNGRKLEGTTEEKFDKFLNWANDNKWGNNHMILSDMYDHFNPQEEVIEEAQPKGKQKGNANWMEYAPLGIDAYLAARSFAPVDYSRANAVMNTPIRDIQYNPNGQYIKPYIIDPRQQYMMNYANAQATNRAIQNNAGGNGANAVAAMLANNAAANQAAAQLGYQADAQNAAQLQAAIQANNAVDARNAEGFLQAAAENQRADQIRGNFRATGLQMKDALDSARGQAISNSMGAIADDINNLNEYQYGKNWNKALAGAGYYGNLTPEGMRLVGINYQNIPQAELDRQNAMQIAQMQSEDARLAREQQERINESQLAAMAQQAAMNYPYYE